MTLITRARPADSLALGRVMFRAIRGASAYTLAERLAWMPTYPTASRFRRRLSQCDVWVARGCRGPEGFVAMGPGGYIDLAFVMPHAQGRGLFRCLIETATERRDLCWTHASLSAQPAFSALGFRIDCHETVRRGGQRLRRAVMRRDRGLNQTPVCGSDP